MAGWIGIYRDIREHWIWEDSQKLKWWLDIILSANHQDKKVTLGTELIYIKRGSFHTSECKLGTRWGVSRNTVRAFLALLEKDEMITLEKSKKGTTLKVNNYNDYQGFQEVEKTIKKPFTEQQSEQIKNHSLNTNNNDNNDNNENNSNLVSIQRAYEDAFGNLISPFILDTLASYLEQVEVEVIVLALQTAASKNKREIAYVKGILNKCVEKMIKTADEFKLSQENHNKNRKGVDGGGKSNPGTIEQNSERNPSELQEYMRNNGIQPTFDNNLPY